MYKTLFVSKASYFCCCGNAGVSHRFEMNCLTCQGHFCFVNCYFGLVLPQKGRAAAVTPSALALGAVAMLGHPPALKLGERGALTKPCLIPFS